MMNRAIHCLRCSLDVSCKSASGFTPFGARVAQDHFKLQCVVLGQSCSISGFTRRLKSLEKSGRYQCATLTGHMITEPFSDWQRIFNGV